MSAEKVSRENSQMNADPSPSGSPVPGSAPAGAVKGRRGAGKLLLAVVFIAGLALFFALGGADILRLQTLQEHREVLLTRVEARPAASAAAAVAIYALTTALSVPGAAVLSLAVGFLFGRWLGTLLVVTGATIGATAVFLAARYLFGDALRSRLGARGQRLAEAFVDDGFNYLLFLRLVPLFPFWMVNLAPAFTRLPTRTFVLATAVGIVPGTFVYVNLGRSFAGIESTRDLVGGEVLLALGLLGALALVPLVVRRLRRTAGADPAAEPPAAAPPEAPPEASPEASPAASPAEPAGAAPPAESPADDTPY